MFLSAIMTFVPRFPISFFRVLPFVKSLKSRHPQYLARTSRVLCRGIMGSFRYPHRRLRVVGLNSFPARRNMSSASASNCRGVDTGVPYVCSTLLHRSFSCPTGMSGIFFLSIFLRYQKRGIVAGFSMYLRLNSSSLMQSMRIPWMSVTTPQAPHVMQDIRMVSMPPQVFPSTKY